MTQTIAFLGGGNMATAIIGGLIERGVNPSLLSVVEINSNNRQKLKADFGIHTHDKVTDVDHADIWVLAVKPQQMQEALASLIPILSKKQLLISIAAGLTVNTLSQWAGNHTKIARTMPNTPAMVGHGITGIYAPHTVFTENEQSIIDRIFKAVGTTVWLNQESEIDAITAISGSGPAYVFYMMEQLAAAAVQLGFSADTADVLVKQTFAGSINLANTSAQNLSTLRENVTSKGGTTAAALQAFTDHHLGNAIEAGVQACQHRAVELSQELSKS